LARGRRRQRPGSAGKARRSSAGARACSVIDGVLDAAFPCPKDDVLECRTATGSAGGWWLEGLGWPGFAGINDLHRWSPWHERAPCELYRLSLGSTKWRMLQRREMGCNDPPFTKGKSPVYLCHSLDQ
jgi:hypothetical protein